MPDYVICARNVKGKKFGDEPAPSSYLFVPDDAQPSPDHAQSSRDKWATRVLADARKGVPKGELGNILVFVHGYNNSQQTVIERHRRLRDDLSAGGFKGVVVSFDWPSGDKGLFYLEDLVDANKSAFQLVGDGIMLLAGLQVPDCKVNIHILAHSVGERLAAPERGHHQQAERRGTVRPALRMGARRGDPPPHSGRQPRDTLRLRTVLGRFQFGRAIGSSTSEDFFEEPLHRHFVFPVRALLGWI